MKSGYPIWTNLIQNDYEHIENLVTIDDEDITYLRYPTDTKALKCLYKGHQNHIRIFIAYFHYDSYHIGNDWVKVNNENFNEIHIIVYDYFSSLRKDGLVNHRPTSTTSSFKQYYINDNFNRSIKYDPALFPVFKDQSLVMVTVTR